jgi:hypothetical protein
VIQAVVVAGSLPNVTFMDVLRSDEMGWHLYTAAALAARDLSEEG